MASAALLGLGLAPPLLAASAEEAQVEERRLLGCGCEQAARQELLPFTRAIGISGTVKRSLAASAKAAGVPPAVMIEALKALATEIDLDRDVKDGDRFYVRYQQTYTLAGDPIDVGRVLWAELKTQKRGTLALHRFKPARDAPAHEAQASLWFASGKGTLDPQLSLPIQPAVVTSGFGLRADPFDQPYMNLLPMGPVSHAGSNLGTPTASAGPSPPGAGALAVDQPTARGRAAGLVSPSMYMSYGRGPSYRGPMVMHAGVDLLAPPGTPIEAAGEGVVVGAQPNGRYGNWVEIDHGDTLRPGSGQRLATVYGHLTSFADGIVPGAHVNKAQLIGFTGNTGRTTGPHLHFEILTNGHPGNPIGHPATKHAQLRGPDLERFRKLVSADQAERAREAKSM